LIRSCIARKWSIENNVDSDNLVRRIHEKLSRMVIFFGMGILLSSEHIEFMVFPYVQYYILKNLQQITYNESIFSSQK
jgi:hypothetical protein